MIHGVNFDHSLGIYKVPRDWDRALEQAQFKKNMTTVQIK